MRIPPFYQPFGRKTAERLAGLAPEGVNRVYIVSSGSEAMEAALKLARQYAVEAAAAAQTHNRAPAELSWQHAGCVSGRRQPVAPQTVEPLLVETSLIAPCYSYRDQRSDETPAAYGRRVADALEAEIPSVGAENVLAFIAEPVVGATAGALTLRPDISSGSARYVTSMECC